MSEESGQIIEAANSRLAELLDNAQGALHGRGGFDAEEIRALRSVLEAMGPVVAHSAELRSKQPELGYALDVYRAQLVALQKTVEKIRIILLVHRAALEANRTQVFATSQWCTAFQQTR